MALLSRTLPLTLSVLGLLSACTTSQHFDLRSPSVLRPALETELIPRTTLFGNPDRGQVRMSPDGNKLSWLAPVDGVLNIWIAPVDDISKAQPLTRSTERSITNHQWGFNSQYVLYRQDKDGDENYHIFATDVATGATRDLTPVRDGVRASIEARSASRPNKIVVGMNDRDTEVFDLHLVDVATGESELLKINPGFGAWLIDNELKPRYGYETPPGGGAQVIDFDGNILVDIPMDDYLTSDFAGFDASGRFLYALDSRDRDKAALVRIDTHDGSVEPLGVNAQADVGTVLYHPTTRRPLAYSAEFLTQKWYVLDPAFTEDFRFLQQQLDGNIGIVSISDDLAKLIVYVSGPQSPTHYYIYDRQARSLVSLFTTRPELERAGLQPMHPVEIRARDGLSLVSYLTLPPGSDDDGDARPDSPLPMVLSVHGGPWERDSYRYDPYVQWLANRGYAVLSVNFRGSTGFGKAFLNAATREFAGKMHDDLIDGVDWAVAEGITEPGRIGITGGSYGGYATLVGLAFTPDVFACGAARVAPSNLVTLIESFPDYVKPYLESDWYRFVGNPEIASDRRDMLARSPIMRAERIEKPLLISHGANDPRVAKAESDTIVAAMAANGLPVTYANFPDEGHGFARPANQFANYALTEHFFAECLGGRAEPFGDALDRSSIEILHGAHYVGGLENALAARRGT